jgi:hypothetical protein
MTQIGTNGIGGSGRHNGRGGTINGVKKISFPPVTASQVRVNILKTKGDRPTLGEIRVLAPETK